VNGCTFGWVCVSFTCAWVAPPASSRRWLRSSNSFCNSFTFFSACSKHPRWSMHTVVTRQRDHYLPHQRFSAASVGICLWTTSWRQFTSNGHQTSSVIPLATGDEVIKFWKVKVKSQGRCVRYALYWALLVDWRDHHFTYRHNNRFGNYDDHVSGGKRNVTVWRPSDRHCESRGQRNFGPTIRTTDIPRITMLSFLVDCRLLKSVSIATFHSVFGEHLNLGLDHALINKLHCTNHTKTWFDRKRTETKADSRETQMIINNRTFYSE